MVTPSKFSSLNSLQRRRPQFTKGFTLIEVLIAILIVSLAIVSVIEVTGKHVNNISELEKRMVASWVANNHVAEIRHDAKINKIRDGSDVERVTMGGQKWRSRARIKETDVDKVYLVNIKVTSEDESNDKVYSAVTTAVTDRL